MKFNYEYRTSANEQKSGSVSASSRDAAFQLLKAQGIRPSRVKLAPGFVNRLASFGKRGWAIIALAFVLSVSVLLIVTGRVVEHPLATADLEPEVVERLKASGLDVGAVNALLDARRRVNELYRQKIEDDVRHGRISRKAADELLSAVGLTRP